MVPSEMAREMIMEAFRNAERFPPLAESSDRPARNSQHSQHSPGIHAPFRLDEVEMAAFEERAAIIEFDGGLQRDVAEVKALQSVLARRHSSQAERNPSRSE